jgi:hypothetical protein
MSGLPFGSRAGPAPGGALDVPDRTHGGDSSYGYGQVRIQKPPRERQHTLPVLAAPEACTGDTSPQGSCHEQLGRQLEVSSGWKTCERRCGFPEVTTEVGTIEWATVGRRVGQYWSGNAAAGMNSAWLQPGFEATGRERNGEAHARYRHHPGHCRGTHRVPAGVLDGSSHSGWAPAGLHR